MMLDHWKVISTEKVRADKWITLRSDTCLTGSGETVAPYYVLEYPDWAHVVALTADDRMVMVRQYRHGLGEVTLELPGGAVDAHDADLEQAARRELREETGYVAGAMTHVTSLSPNPATHTNKLHVFLALDVRLEAEQETDPGEDIVVELMSVSDVIAAMRAGRVQQSMHVASALLALAEAGRIHL